MENAAIRTPIKAHHRTTVNRTSKPNVDLNTTHYPSVAEAISNFQNIILEAERELSASSLKDGRSESIRSFEAKMGLPRLSSKITRRKSVNVRYSKSRLENDDYSSSSLKSHEYQSRSNLSNNSRSSLESNNGQSNLPTANLTSRSSNLNSRSNLTGRSSNLTSRSNLNSRTSNGNQATYATCRPSADSDDEKSKKKALNSSIVDKRNKLNNQLNFDNANEHFTNLLRLRNEGTLIRLVKMHLLMLLDLDGENFSNVFEEDSTMNKKTNTSKKKKQDNKSHDKGLFQQVLTEEGICRLYLLTDFIGRPKNINQEGVFRKCGSTARQQELKYRLQNNIPLELETGKYTVHDCTNVLKTCLSDMPEPLLTDLFFKIITQKLISKENSHNEQRCFTELDFEKIFGDKNLKIIQLILLLIPLKKRKFAQDLLSLLFKIASKENSTNKMDAKSLATLFAPHLLCPKSMTPADLQRYITILTVQLEFMIKHVKQIFKTPVELTLDIRKELERMDNPNANEEDDGLNTVVTFCDRQAAKTADNQTEQHIAELYAHIQGMPETPAKKKLIKQFNRQNGGLTPLVDKENSKKKQNKLKQIGDKLKNAKNLFKANTNSAVKSAMKRDSEYGSQDHLNDYQSDCKSTGSGGGGYKSDNTNSYCDFKNEESLFHAKPLSPCKTKDIPLADLTVTKFCLDEEDTTEDLLMYHKKLRVGNSTNDEIFVDYPYASESILL